MKKEQAKLLLQHARETVKKYNPRLAYGMYQTNPYENCFCVLGAAFVSLEDKLPNEVDYYNYDPVFGKTRFPLDLLYKFARENNKLISPTKRKHKTLLSVIEALEEKYDIQYE